MNNKELLQQLKNDLLGCKPNKKESINLIVKLLKHTKKTIESQYNLGCIAECIIKSYFTNNAIITPSPKGVNDLNIEISSYNLNKYFNGINSNDIDIKYINNYSTAHKPLTSKYLLCITPKGCYMIHSDIVEYNKDNKIILSSVYKNAIHLRHLTKKIGL